MATAVDDFPEGPGTSGSLTIGTPVRGNLERPRDGDWFAITLEAGTPYLFDLTRKQEDFRWDYGYVALALYDADGEPVAWPVAGDGDDRPVLAFTPYESGTYYVSVKGLSIFDTLGAYELRASVRTGPDDFPFDPSTTGVIPVNGEIRARFEVAGDVDLFRFEAEAGFRYQFDEVAPGPDGWVDWTPPHTIRVFDAEGYLVSLPGAIFEPLASGVYYVEAIGLRSAGYGIVNQSWKDDFRNDFHMLTWVEPGAAQSGTLEYRLDQDKFNVVLEENRFYTVTLKSPASFSVMIDMAPANTYDFFASARGSVMGGDFRMIVNPSFSGEFVLTVSTQSTRYGTDPVPYTFELDQGVLDDAGDTRANARSTALGKLEQATLQAAIDIDVFKIPLLAGVKYAVLLQATEGANRDLRVEIAEDFGGPIAIGKKRWAGHVDLCHRDPLCVR